MFSIFTTAKSFRANKVIGSRLLNQWGLHIARRKAAAMAARVYRAVLGLRLSAAERNAFDEAGFVALPSFLPEEELAAIRRELMSAEWPLVEMSQPPARTLRVNLDAKLCGENFPALGRIIGNPRLLRWLRYAAGYPGTPIVALQIVRIAEVGQGHDPQADWHRDTFHSAAKAWLFLHDVLPQKGPFGYVPGSHRPTPAHWRWEHAQSIDAANDENDMHSSGSFRADEATLRNLGYGEPYTATVQGNTLVVADTSGFHRRTPSQEPSVRLEIYFSLRRNPFFAGLYPSALGLPFVRSRWAGWAYRYFVYRHHTPKPDWIPLGTHALQADERAQLEGWKSVDCGSSPQ